MLMWVNWLIDNAALSAGVSVETRLGRCFGFHWILTTKLVVHETCDWRGGGVWEVGGGGRMEAVMKEQRQAYTQQRGKVTEVISASCGPLSQSECVSLFTMLEQHYRQNINALR